VMKEECNFENENLRFQGRTSVLGFDFGKAHTSFVICTPTCSYASIGKYFSIVDDGGEHTKFRENFVIK